MEEQRQQNQNNNQNQNAAYSYYQPQYYSVYNNPENERLMQELREKKEKELRKQEKKEQKKAKKAAGKNGGFMKRLGTLVLSAIVFGVVAGGTMYGINYAGIKLFGEKETVKSEAQADEDLDKIEDILDESNSGNPDHIISSTSDSVVNEADMEEYSNIYDVRGVVKRCMPSVVTIVNTYTAEYSYWGQSYEQEEQSSGTGIIIGQSDTELLLVSNHHVVADADELIITFIDGTTAEAHIKGSDADMDIAVIAISLNTLTQETMEAIAIAVLGDSDTLEVGEPAIAIGNALGYGQSVTTGVISAVNRELEIEGVMHTLVQTDAAINPGNSGGALLNLNGEVVGINSNKIGGTTIEGMGYAIPISLVKELIEELSLKETLIKVEEGKEGYLGIYGQNVTDDVSSMYEIPIGVYISQVIEDSGAEDAGLRRGDIIVKLNDTTIKSMDDLTGILQYYEAGTTVQITIQRKKAGIYQEKVVDLVLGKRSE